MKHSMAVATMPGRSKGRLTFSSTCQCGGPDCRGRITGNDWQLPDLWERYRGHFSPYLQRRIDADTVPVRANGTPVACVSNASTRLEHDLLGDAEVPDRACGERRAGGVAGDPPRRAERRGSGGHAGRRRRPARHGRGDGGGRRLVRRAAGRAAPPCGHVGSHRAADPERRPGDGDCVGHADAARLSARPRRGHQRLRCGICPGRCRRGHRGPPARGSAPPAGERERHHAVHSVDDDVTLWLGLGRTHLDECTVPTSTVPESKETGRRRWEERACRSWRWSSAGASCSSR